jgi:hypothetical protein
MWMLGGSEAAAVAPSLPLVTEIVAARNVPPDWPGDAGFKRDKRP